MSYISPILMRITRNQIALLDQEQNNGDGWNYYSNGQVLNASVYNDEISGIVREYVNDYKVKIKVNEYEISCSCTCDSGKVACSHVIALLYSWVYDQNEFTNVGDVIEQLASMDKNVLISVIERFLTEDPQNIKYFDRQRDLEIDDLIFDNKIT